MTSDELLDVYADSEEKQKRIMGDPEWCKASVEVNVTFRGDLDTSLFKEHKINQLAGIFKPDAIRNQILSRRSEEQKIKDKERGAVYLTKVEMEELEVLLQESENSKNDPVAKKLEMVSEEFQEKVNDVLLPLRSEQVCIYPRFEKPTGHDFQISSEDISFSIKPGWQKFLLKTGWSLGLIPLPKEPIRGPVISASVSIEISGIGGQVDSLAQQIKSKLSSLGNKSFIEVELMYPNQKINKETVVTKHNMDSALPLAGEKFVLKIKELSALIKSEDISASFICAQEIISMFKQNRSLARVFANDGEYSHTRIGIFCYDKNGKYCKTGDRSEKEVACTLQTKLEELRNSRDLDGLCDLFFEYSPQGIWNGLEDRTQSVYNGTKPSKFYDNAFFQTFGSAKSFELIIHDIRREGIIPKTQRLRKLDETHREELDALIQARDEAWALDDSSSKISP